MAFHTNRFPNEDAQYREARDRLLAAEAELRSMVAQVAELRRALPPGGAVPDDYQLTASTGEPTQLSGLFREGKNTLVVYSYMYAPDDDAPCPMCTAFLDSLDGNALHLEQRVNLAVIAKASARTLREWSVQRGWRHLRLYSSENSSLNADYFAESPDGDQWPMVTVFRRHDGAIRHSYSSELFFCEPMPGTDPRHVDMLWPVWNVLDLTPEGRGDWYPALRYD